MQSVGCFEIKIAEVFENSLKKCLGEGLVCSPRKDGSNLNFIPKCYLKFLVKIYLYLLANKFLHAKAGFFS